MKSAGRVMFFCSMSVAGNPLVGNKAYPRIVSDYRASFARLKTMKADVFLAPHGDQFGLARKYAALQDNEKKKLVNAANPFIDKGEMQRVVAGQEKAFDAQLKREQDAVVKR